MTVERLQSHDIRLQNRSWLAKSRDCSNEFGIRCGCSWSCDLRRYSLHKTYLHPWSCPWRRRAVPWWNRRSDRSKLVGREGRLSDRMIPARFWTFPWGVLPGVEREHCLPNWQAAHLGGSTVVEPILIPIGPRSPHLPSHWVCCHPRWPHLVCQRKSHCYREVRCEVDSSVMPSRARA